MNISLRGCDLFISLEAVEEQVWREGQGKTTGVEGRDGGREQWEYLKDKEVGVGKQREREVDGSELFLVQNL